MATESVSIHLNGPDQDPVNVVLRNATNGDGIYRNNLKFLVFTEIGDGPDLHGLSEIEITELNAPRIQAAIFYPACLACVESPREARILPLKKYRELPEDEQDNWTNTAFRLNAHWNKHVIEEAAKAVQEAAEKKSGT